MKLINILFALMFASTIANGQQAATNAPVPFAWVSSNYTDKVFQTTTDANDVCNPAFKGKIIKYVNTPKVGPGVGPLCGQVYLVNFGFFNAIFPREKLSHYKALCNGKIKGQAKSSVFYVYIPDDELFKRICADVQQATGNINLSVGLPLCIIVGLNSKSGLGGTSYSW